MAESNDRWFSVDEICKHLGVSKDTVYKWIDKHKMPAHRMGRLWKFKKDQVDTWVEAGGEALALKCDVSLKDDVDRVVAATIEKFGQIDILVNNAQNFGRYHTIEGYPFEETTEEDWDAILKSGLMGTFYFMKACFPHMKEKGGKIINCGSAAGTQLWVGQTPYGATKEAIRAITGVAAREWGKYGINVNVFCPVATSKEALTRAKTSPDMTEAARQMIPLGRMGDCEKDIGRAIVFLASSDSDYMTGQTFNIDGGIDIHA